ncbi:MAG: zinc metallopeptidase [Bacteroidales bacterium]|nr:zinc metallopeptidase [Bacteroidales bacterium]
MMIWIVMIAVMILSFIIQWMLKKRFREYGEVPITSGLTGAQVAQRMLLDNGIRDVSVVCVDGSLTDHYNPETRTVNLSEDVFHGRSVASAAVAAHECGHALQHAAGYGPLKLRTALVPVVTFANKWVMWVLLAGILLVEVFPQLLWIGIGLFALTTLFSLITLPVEINASRRALGWLEVAGITNYETRPMAASALRWAAYTYVIAALGSIATLFYYISIGSRR